MGTSDPVRGYRDGPMLHIMRHYKPEKVYVFLSDEASDLDKKDSRIQAVADFIRLSWDYSPEINILKTDITDPSDIDVVAEPITAAVKKLSEEYTGSEILLNLSSGTPQMKTVLAMLSTDMRYNTTGIQVKTPEKRAGTADRTNKLDYSVGDELELNEDEALYSENRCTVPELLHIQRQQSKAQITALLDQRNYTAVYSMKDKMPDELKALVGHLEARDRLQTETAKNRAQNLKLPFPLYPVKNSAKRSDYAEVSEAYLVLRNRQHRGQYEEMVLRLNPLIVRLELRIMGNALSDMGIRLENVIDRPYSMRPHFVPEKLMNLLPKVYEDVNASFGGALRESDVSISLCISILKALPGVPASTLDFLRKCEALNDSCRNELAHQLTSVTEQQLCDSCGMHPAQLISRLGDLIAELYPECDKRLFDIYKRCGDYIKEKLM